MKSPAKQTPWLILFVWLALSPFWLQRESLWIDEAGSAVKVLADSSTGVWQELMEEKNSNLHLPLYHYYLWGYSRIMGRSELALRAGNIPWMLLGFVTLLLGASSAAGNASRPIWLALFLTSSPFLLYYSNEVRPYAMQFGLAATAFVGMLRTRENASSFFWKSSMAVGTVLLAWTSVYGLAWWVINLGFWFCRPNDKKFGFLHQAVSGFLVLGGACALVFHVWVLRQGAGASPIGQTSWKSLGYALCEWSGAAGFLPGRSVLRAGHLPSLAESALPLVTICLCLVLVVTGATSIRRSRTHGFAVFAWTFPALGIIGSGVCKSFRLVGRHFMPVAPSFFWFLSEAPQSSLGRRWTRLASSALIMLWIWSDMRLATLPEHRKDDYRDAVHYILQNRQRGETVWWAADEAGARFYGLSNYTFVANRKLEDLQQTPSPDWLVLSKGDVYDLHHALQAYVVQHPAERKTTFPSFEVYRISPRHYDESGR